MPKANDQIIRRTDPIRIEVFKNLFSAIAEEMGAVLRKASFSPNIKERCDFSCAVFDADGNMVAQASHIPVHLGSMPLSVSSTIKTFDDEGQTISPGDTIILNDPFLGGTHLPDITLITPVFLPNNTHIPENSSQECEVSDNIRQPFAYVANRAHHSDIGGMAPGSMPVAREIFQEGLIIPPIKLVSVGELNHDVYNLILANVRTPDERSGDIRAQIGANQRGEKLFSELLHRYGEAEVDLYMHELQNYSERMTRQLLRNLPDGTYSFEDWMDNDGISREKISIKAAIKIEDDHATIDFSGSAHQQQGSVNAVYAITLSAVNYVFRTLIGLDAPNNSGCLVPIQIIAPPGSIVNAIKPAAVAGGNVETSQRIVDVLLGALAQVCPERIPAASQGSMNNFSIGGWDPVRNRYFTYYETIGGGTGANASSDGVSAIHSHMTNTLNTPIEALEYDFPLEVARYAIRQESGGKGIHTGGDGIIREIRFLTDAQVTLLTDRREIKPYGLYGGGAGKPGRNIMVHENAEHRLPSKGSFYVVPGDKLIIHTPGGGGFGASQ